MNKIKKILSALLVTGVVAAMPLCASAENCLYNSRGEWKDIIWHLSTAIVEADGDIFNKRLSYSNDEYGERYGCFGSSTGPETLTVGSFFNPLYSEDERNGLLNKTAHYARVFKVISNKQIQYIKNNGGIVTGCSIVDNDGAGKALNISWDMGEMHHFARFELNDFSRATIGYYDLMYTGSRSIDIKSMNDSFYLVVDWRPL